MNGNSNDVLALDVPVIYAIARTDNLFHVAVKMEAQKRGPHFIKLDDTSRVYDTDGRLKSFGDYVAGDTVKVEKLQAVGQSVGTLDGLQAAIWPNGNLSPEARIVRAFHEHALDRRTQLAIVSFARNGKKATTAAKFFDPLTQTERSLPLSKTTQVKTNDLVLVTFAVKPLGTWRHIGGKYQAPPNIPYKPTTCIPTKEETYEPLSCRKPSKEELKLYEDVFSNQAQGPMAKGSKIAQQLLAGAAMMQQLSDRDRHLGSSTIAVGLLEDGEYDVLLEAAYRPAGGNSLKIDEDRTKAARAMAPDQHLWIGPQARLGGSEPRMILAKIKHSDISKEFVRCTLVVSKDQAERLWNETWPELLKRDWSFKCSKNIVLQKHFLQRLRGGALEDHPEARIVRAFHEHALDRRTQLAIVSFARNGKKATTAAKFFDPLTQTERSLPLSKTTQVKTNDLVLVTFAVKPLGTWRHIGGKYQAPPNIPYKPTTCIPTKEETYEPLSCRKPSKEELKLYEDVFSNQAQGPMAKGSKIAQQLLAGAAMMQQLSDRDRHLGSSTIAVGLLEDGEYDVLLEAAYRPAGGNSLKIDEDRTKAARAMAPDQHLWIGPQARLGGSEPRMILAKIKHSDISKEFVRCTLVVSKDQAERLWNETWPELLKRDWSFKCSKNIVLQKHFLQRLRGGALEDHPEARIVRAFHEHALDRRTQLAIVSFARNGKKATTAAKFFDPLTQTERSLPLSKTTQVKTNDLVLVTFAVKPLGTWRHIGGKYQAPPNIPYKPTTCIPTKEETYEPLSCRKPSKEELKLYEDVFSNQAQGPMAKGSKIAQQLLAGAAMMQQLSDRDRHLGSSTIAVGLLEDGEYDVLLEAAYRPAGGNSLKIDEDRTKAARAMAPDQHLWIGPQARLGGSEPRMILAKIKHSDISKEFVRCTLVVSKDQAERLWNETWPELLKRDWSFKCSKNIVLQKHFLQRLRGGALEDQFARNPDRPALQILRASA
ncbi:hypothetical protein AAVH_29854 [Aphelenchoides avenae]|nr:hypothetical protein AAVH_29854 [Aphelenchus avenae]